MAGPLLETQPWLRHFAWRFHSKKCECECFNKVPPPQWFLSQELNLPETGLRLLKKMAEARPTPGLPISYDILRLSLFKRPFFAVQQVFMLASMKQLLELATWAEKLEASSRSERSASHVVEVLMDKHLGIVFIKTSVFGKSSSINKCKLKWLKCFQSPSLLAYMVKLWASIMLVRPRPWFSALILAPLRWRFLEPWTWGLVGQNPGVLVNNSRR